MKGKKLRIRNISPWVSKQQESNRNELQAFLNKNQVGGDDTQNTKHVWSKSKTIDYQNQTQGNTAQPKVKLFYKTFTEFSKPTQTSYNRKFYSQSSFLQKKKEDKQRQQIQSDKVIFAKKYKISHKPKLVKVVNACLEPNLSQISKTDFIAKLNDDNSKEFRARIQKKKIMLKKQSLTQTILKDQILGHKKFINSLQHCLFDIQRVSYNQESSKLLCTTLKSFLNRCKRI